MDIKTLREEFGTAQKEAQDVITAAAVAKRDLSAEEKSANDLRFNRMDQIKKQFDESERFAALSLKELKAVLPKEPEGKTEFQKTESRNEFSKADGAFDLDKYRAAINTFARTGETRQLYTITTGTQSGAYLPKDVLQPVTIRRLRNSFRAILDAFGLNPIETDSLAAFSLPVADDTANLGQAQNESATTGTELDPSNANSINISPTVYSSKQFWYSNTMVMAQGFDIVGFTLPQAQRRIDKIQEQAWTNILTAGASVGYALPSPIAITYADVLNWEHSLAPAYRADAGYIVSDSLYRGMRGIVDTQNRPIFDQNPNDKFQATLHGKPIVINDYFGTLAANHFIGTFISSDAIKIVDVQNARLARYAMYPAKPDQIGFEMFQNGDCGFVYAGLSLLKSAIS